MEDKLIVELKPKVGIDEIKFGTPRDIVRKILEKDYKCYDITHRDHNIDMYFQNMLGFEYADDNTLSYISVSAPPPIYLKLLGINTWEISGEVLLNKLKEIDKIDKDSFEWESNPIFVNNIITLYEMDEQYDRIGNYSVAKWAAIGIGDERYYKSIKEIQNVNFDQISFSYRKSFYEFIKEKGEEIQSRIQDLYFRIFRLNK